MMQQQQELNNNLCHRERFPANCSFPALLTGGPYIWYRMDPVDHPVHGKATFTGNTPLLLPFRGHTRGEILPELSQCKTVAAALIDVGRTVWADDDDDTILYKLEEYAFICSIMSGMKPGEPRFPLFVHAMVLFITVDDQLDSMESLQQITGSLKQLTELYQSCDPIFDQPIPSATVEMARMLTSWEALKVKLLKIPNFDEKYKTALRHEIYLFLASHATQVDFQKSGLQFSEMSSRELLRNIASPAIVTEYVAIMRDAILPGHVRSNVLFGVARNRVSDIEIGVNTLFGLHRDIRMGQLDSPIMVAVTKGRLTLQDAIDKTHTELLDAMGDLKLATDKLLELYGGDEDVQRYINIWVGGMDGMIYSYKFFERYNLGDKLTLFQN